MTEEELELLDPTPDIHALFCYYNDLYFQSSLESRVMVEWSSERMTSCGGTCAALPGGGILIRLSKPLLRLRPTSDLKDVLLHEMIHAYIMAHRIPDSDPSGHGKPFQSIMHSINQSSAPDMYRPAGRGYRITIYHTMFEEVEFYRRHHWICSVCGDEVKRAVNRRPQVSDCRWYSKVKERGDCGDLKCRWHMHQKFCAGEYVKIAEPEKKVAKKVAKKKKEEQTTKRPIEDYMIRSRPSDSMSTFGNKNSPTNLPYDTIDLTLETDVVDLT
jgi:predicted SprT family Zn-dependent metalloprotease